MSFEKPKLNDRIYIDEKYNDFIDNSVIFGFKTRGIERKDQLLFAIALGYKIGKPTPISGNKRQLINIAYLDDEDNALLYALAFDTKKDINVVSGSVDALNYVYKLSEEYANTGLSFLMNFEKQCSYENYSKKFEKEIINNHLKSIEKEEDS